MLIGRLGNSMFQIAASIGYARKYGYDWAVQEIPHNNESAIHRVFPNLPKTNFKGESHQEHPHGFCERHQTSFDECHFDYHPIPDLGPNAFLRGFWQSYKYFEGYEDEIKKVFELPHVPGYENYVSIHVRRGDYVHHAGSFPPITDKFLYYAMGMFTIGLGHKTDGINARKFIFFSDDISWCKEFVSSGLEFMERMEGGKVHHVKEDDLIIEFSEGRNELEDLSIMASCGHHIIANSTFSWWGAYLGHNPDRIVITPSQERGSWFGLQAGVKRAVVDLLPPNWIQIHGQL